VHEFALTIETRDGTRTLAAIARGGFSLWPEHELGIYHGRAADADFFASAVAQAASGNPDGWNYLRLTGNQLRQIRARSVNIRGVGYRQNPDPFVQKMAYSGSNVDQSSEVRRADRRAVLHRITIEIQVGSGKRTIQLMGSGNMLGFGCIQADFEDLTDVIEEVMRG